MVEPNQESRSFQLPKSIGLAVKLLERISPALTSYFLLQKFFSPIKFPTPQSEMFFKQTCALRREKINDKTVTIYHKGIQGPHVLFCHGWSGRSTQFANLASFLIDNGFRVTLFTAPAHGSSEDAKTDLREFVETLHFCHKSYGPFDAVIGHSLGGIAVINAVKEGLPVNKIVTIGSPASISGVVDDFMNLVGAGGTTKKVFTEALEKRYQQPLDASAPVQLIAGNSFPEGLIIHDEDDLDAGVHYAKELHAVWPNSRTLITKGLGHRRILSDVEVGKTILSFLTEKISD